MHKYMIKTQNGEEVVHAKLPYGTSTVAMGVYNMIAMGRGSSEFVDVLSSIRLNGLPLVERVQLEDAFRELLARRYIKEVEPGRFDVRDPKRRMIVRRDRTDTGIGKGGIPFGGWNSWLVRGGDGLRRLDEVVR